MASPTVTGAAGNKRETEQPMSHDAAEKARHGVPGGAPRHAETEYAGGSRGSRMPNEMETPEATAEVTGTSDQTSPVSREQEWTMLSGVAVSVSPVTHGTLHLVAPDTTKDLIENLLWKRATGSVGLTCWDILDCLTPLMDVGYDEVSDMLYEMRSVGRIRTIAGWTEDVEYTAW